MKNGQPPPPPPSHPPPIKHIEKGEENNNKITKNATATFINNNNKMQYNIMMDDDENETYQINVNSPYRADAVATPPRQSRKRQDLNKMSNVKNWITKNSHVLKNNINVLKEQRNRIQELELKLNDRNDQMKLLEFQHPFIAKDKDHFPDFDQAFENMDAKKVNENGEEEEEEEDDEDDELFVDPTQNEESFQNLNFSIDTLAHLHGLKDFSTDDKDGEKGLLRQDSIEDVMRNRPSIGKPTILDSGSAIDKLKTPLRVRNYEKKSSPTIQRGEQDNGLTNNDFLGDDDAPTMATLYEHVQKQQRLEVEGGGRRTNLHHNNNIASKSVNNIIGNDRENNNIISPIQQNNDDVDNSHIQEERRISMGGGRPSTDSIESKHRLSIGTRPSFGGEDDELVGDHFQKMNASFGSDDASSTVSNRRISLNGLELVASDVGSTNSNNTVTIGGMDDDGTGHSPANNSNYNDSNNNKKKTLSDILHSTPTRNNNNNLANNKYRSTSSMKKRNLTVPTPGLSPILSSNESDSRGEMSFNSNDTNSGSRDNSLTNDRKISRSLVFEDVDEEEEEEEGLVEKIRGEEQHQQMKQQNYNNNNNNNSNTSMNNSSGSSNGGITLPGGNKSQSTLLFRNDLNDDNLTGFQTGNNTNVTTPNKNHDLQMKDLSHGSNFFNNSAEKEKQIELKRRHNTEYILNHLNNNNNNKNKIIDTPGLSPIINEGDHRLARRQRSLIMESKSNLSLHAMSPLKETPSMLDLSNEDESANMSHNNNNRSVTKNNNYNNQYTQNGIPSPFKFTSPMKETPSMANLDSSASMSDIVEDEFNSTNNSNNSNANYHHQQSYRNGNESFNKRSAAPLTTASSTFLRNSRANNYGTYILEAQRFGITNLEAQYEYAQLLAKRGNNHRRVANRRFSFERDCYETSFVTSPEFGKTTLNATASIAGNTGFARTARTYNHRTKQYQDPLKSMFDTSYNNADHFKALNIDPTIKKYSSNYWSKKIAGRSPSGLKA